MYSHFFFSSIWRWKDLSCCFLLLHYLLRCASLLARFISDFDGCFWRSLWNSFLTPNNPLPAFFPLTTCFSLMIKKPDFQSEASLRLKPPSILCCPEERKRCFGWCLTWKKNTESSLSLALLASLAQYGWTSNDLPGVICVPTEGTWVLFYVPRWIVDEVGGVWTELMFHI